MVRVPFSQLAGRARQWRSPSVLSRLPEHYYKHSMQLKKEGERVHNVPIPAQIADYTLADAETLRVDRINDPPLDVVYPKEADEGIWGGEGVVKGFIKERNFNGIYNSKYWWPNLFSSVHYSEILNIYMSVVVTERTNILVDKCEGFDNYLLRTPIEDFKSRLALRLRRKLLISLAREDYYPDDPKMHQYIKEKYADCVVPLEEAEWFGLTTPEALTKLKASEALELSQQNRPLKEVYTMQLLQQINDAAAEAQAKEDDGDSKGSGYISLLKRTK